MLLDTKKPAEELLRQAAAEGVAGQDLFNLVGFIQLLLGKYGAVLEKQQLYHSANILESGAFYLDDLLGQNVNTIRELPPVSL